MAKGDFDFRVEGTGGLINKLTRIQRSAVMQKRMLTAVNLVKNNVVKKLNEKGKGEPYVRYFNGQRIEGTASRPFDPPATFMGELKNNINIEVRPMANGGAIGSIIASAPYAKSLEFGTTKMQPRPFLFPTLEENKSKIKRIFRRRGAFRGITKK